MHKDFIKSHELIVNILFIRFWRDNIGNIFKEKIYAYEEWRRERVE